MQGKAYVNSYACLATCVVSLPVSVLPVYLCYLFTSVACLLILSVYLFCCFLLLCCVLFPRTSLPLNFAFYCFLGCIVLCCIANCTILIFVLYCSGTYIATWTRVIGSASPTCLMPRATWPRFPVTRARLRYIKLCVSFFFHHEMKC